MRSETKPNQAKTQTMPGIGSAPPSNARRPPLNPVSPTGSKFTEQTEKQSTKSQQEKLVNDLMKEDKEEIGKYILNLLQDIKGLRTENKKLKKENYLNSQVETTFKSDLAETLEEYREKIIKLETRNRELEGKLKGSRTN